MADTLRNPHIERAIKICGRQQDLAERAGCAQQTISKYLIGEIRISAEHAVQIERATDGEVARSDLRPDLWPSSSDTVAPEPAEAAQ